MFAYDLLMNLYLLLLKLTNVILNKNFTGAAWLSSARAVRCLVQSFNERNSYFILVHFFTLVL